MRDRTLRSHLLAPLCIALALLQSTLTYAQSQPPVRLSGLQDAALTRQQEFFPSTAFETVHAGGCGVMEGIATASDGSVYFTEITRSVGCSDARACRAAASG